MDCGCGSKCVASIDWRPRGEVGPNRHFSPI
jgi:hypothetical protein